MPKTRRTYKNNGLAKTYEKISGTFSSLCLKSLRPAGRHQIFSQLWNDATSSLRTQILQTINTAPDWTAVDVMRVGLPNDLHTTLLISAKPDSLI